MGFYFTAVTVFLPEDYTVHVLKLLSRLVQKTKYQIGDLISVYTRISLLIYSYKDVIIITSCYGCSGDPLYTQVTHDWLHVSAEYTEAFLNAMQCCSRYTKAREGRLVNVPCNADNKASYGQELEEFRSISK